MECIQYGRNISRVIGEEVLSLAVRRVIFPSQIIPIFLSNALDLLQSMKDLLSICKKVFKYSVVSEDSILVAIQNYDMWKVTLTLENFFHVIC